MEIRLERETAVTCTTIHCLAFDDYEGLCEDERLSLSYPVPLIYRNQSPFVYTQRSLCSMCQFRTVNYADAIPHCDDAMEEHAGWMRRAKDIRKRSDSSPVTEPAKRPK